ncbi:MAG: IS110 family transposase [Pseudonocardiales bacterium]|nr:IS110 family transposase [Pseudonocardiales bacterium]
MKYALIQVLPDVPPGGVVAGIDWASRDHAVCVVDMAGRVRDRFTAAHDKAGIAGLSARLRENGAAEVAIERGDGVLVDALLAAGLTVVVIGSRQVKNLRSRFISSGAKDDRFDAFVLADTLRTDRVRLRPLAPDRPATVALRAAVRARKDLITHRVGACNQLRAHLAAAFPGAIGLFRELDSPLSLAFLAAFPGQQAAARLDEHALARWLAAISHRGNPAPPAVLAARLAAAPPGLAGADGAHAAITAELAAAVAGLAARIKALDTQITAQLAAHPDAHVFTSLPRAGTLRAARLLAEIGDCRPRYPDPWSLAGTAGVTPVTRRSGTYISHHYRWNVNRQLRDAICDFADGSRHASPWAAGIYRDARARGKDHPHAIRITARAWIIVIWRCWHDQVPYDPAKHGALQHLPARQEEQ